MTKPRRSPAPPHLHLRGGLCLWPWGGHTPTLHKALRLAARASGPILVVLNQRPPVAPVEAQNQNPTFLEALGVLRVG